MSPAFWAEPLNAASNVAFLIAAAMAYADLRARDARHGPATGRGAVIGLILLMMLIGTGSFLFHTLATKWALLADVIPIGLFVFTYLLLAARWFLGLKPLAATALALAVAVGSQLLPPWFNGSFGYAPALAAMLVVGAVLHRRGHPAAPWILAAAGVFIVSLTLRTIDAGAGCLVHPPGAAEPAFQIGTHPFWHILNAVTLYLLLRAAIDHRPPGAHGPKQ